MWNKIELGHHYTGQKVVYGFLAPLFVFPQVQASKGTESLILNNVYTKTGAWVGSDQMLTHLDEFILVTWMFLAADTTVFISPHEELSKLLTIVLFHLQGQGH
jgi:hypothetical protein